MQLNAYLLFKGNCEEAFKFYENALGGKIEAMMPFAGTPVEKHVAPEFVPKDHARTTRGGRGSFDGQRRSAGEFDNPKVFRWRCIRMIRRKRSDCFTRCERRAM